MQKTMTLLEFKIINDLTNDELGLMFSVSTETARDWVNGNVVPRPDKMALIYEKTNGQVTPNNFYDLPPADAPAMQGAEVAV